MLMAIKETKIQALQDFDVGLDSSLRQEQIVI